MVGRNRGGPSNDADQQPSPAIPSSLAAELRALDVELFDPPVAPPRVPVPSARDPQRLTLGFADRRARARFLGRCTTEVAERCRGGASAACALAVARFDDDDDGDKQQQTQQQQTQQQQTQTQQQQPTAKRRAGPQQQQQRRPWWARMLLLPWPRRQEGDDDGGDDNGGSNPSRRRRARCEADAARACRDHARSFCRALVDEADGDGAHDGWR